MTMPDPKATLIELLQQARDAMMWKLEGLDDYDVRRPLRTGRDRSALVALKPALCVLPRQ